MNFLKSVFSTEAINPNRDLNIDYIILDTLFLVFLIILLLVKKKYLTLLFSLFGGILYFVVDYGIFYALLKQRVVRGANTALFLFWLSMSYGITNFLLIWLAIKKDENLLEIAFLIFTWWIAVPLIALGNTPKADLPIHIHRKTTGYHGFMALLLFVGYGIVVLYNLKNPKKKLPIVRMFIIGVAVQFAWEFSLLVTGIRKPSIGPLIINSLVETNLGIPFIYFIYLGLTKYLNDDLSRKNKHLETPEQR